MLTVTLEKNGILSSPLLYSTCFSPFSPTEFQVHVLKCTLWDILVMLLCGIVRTERTHSHTLMFPSQLYLQDQQFANRFPFQCVGWADVTWPFQYFPCVHFTQRWVWSKSAAMERRRRRKSYCFSSLLAANICCIWVYRRVMWVRPCFGMWTCCECQMTQFSDWMCVPVAQWKSAGVLSAQFTRWVSRTASQGCLSHLPSGSSSIL